MDKYIAQPRYNANTVTIYDITSGSTAQPIVLSANSAITDVTGTGSNQGGPNSVLIYQDFSGQSSPKQCLIIAYTGASGGDGAVFVFDLDAIMQSGSGQLPSPTTTLTFPGYYPVGMAIQPGTGDLFVATPSTAGGNPTVTIFPKTTGATWSNAGNSSTINYDSLNGFSTVPANLAFDRHGFLWMTSFGGDATYNYLACLMGLVAPIPNTTYPGPPPSPLPVASQASPEFYFANNNSAGSAGMIKVTPLTTSPSIANSMPSRLWGLSSPEGVAFDPDGNLWGG
jgi:hypothetical protein